MIGEMSRQFHDRTSHTWRSVRADGRQLDWARRPPPFKTYPDLPLRSLPVDLAETDWPAVDALSGESPPNRAPLDVRRLAALLFSTAGVTRRWERDGRQRTFRAASSAGALYPIEVYVVVADLDGGLPAGVYHLAPLEFGLRRLRDGDHREVLAAAAADPDLARAPVSLVLTGIPWRTTWKYQRRGYRHLYWDAGTMLANLLGVATGMAEPARVLTGFVDGRVSQLLGLAPDEELPLAIVPVGDPDLDPAPAGDRPDALPHRPASGSAAPTDHLDLLATHRAAELSSAAAVQAWRSTMRELPAHPAARPDPPATAATYDTLEGVILRRGSTRRFSRAEVPAAALAWPLAVAGQPVPCDALAPGATLLTHHAVVHGVEGVTPGLHRLTPDGLEPRRAGRFRGEATQLCLEQALGGEGAYTVFHAADLDRILAGGGERAYRAVLLEGGIALGRAQLAAFTLELGATGLTFYDADVTRFLGPPDEPVCVTAVGVPAYRSRPGQRPAAAARRGR
jgi:SagB-type dehydrogenase family enzyme